MPKHNQLVVTGGPGSGKTSLIEALAGRGLRHMPEAGRAIIQHQCSIGGTGLPWADRRLFAELMLSWELRSHHEAAGHAGPVLFDRGIPDVAGYLRVCGLPVPAHVMRAAETCRYDRQVLIAPPWREIFTQDDERKQSFDEAEATHAAMRDTYSALGYELIELPRASIEERVCFVLERIGQGFTPSPPPPPVAAARPPAPPRPGSARRNPSSPPSA